MPRLASFAVTSARAFGLGSNSSALVATASPTSVSGAGNNASPITITTSSTSVMATGGHGPYTYAWTVLAGSFSITSATSANTTFSKSQGPGASSGTARCTVTDSAGHTATADVAASFNNSYVAPVLPVWSVASGTNMGTWTRGGSFLFVNLWATCANISGNVIYSIVADFNYGSGNTGPEPNWPIGTPTPGGIGQLGGQASAGIVPGDYSMTVTALNPSDSSSSTISVSVTVV